jgi:hypothetical protein
LRVEGKCDARRRKKLKEQLLGVRVFQNVEELRCALAEFRERYKQRWIVQRWGYLTPAQARQQLLALGAAGMNTLDSVSKNPGLHTRCQDTANPNVQASWAKFGLSSIGL